MLSQDCDQTQLTFFSKFMEETNKSEMHYHSSGDENKDANTTHDSRQNPTFQNTIFKNDKNKIETTLFPSKMYRQSIKPYLSSIENEELDDGLEDYEDYRMYIDKSDNVEMKEGLYENDVDEDYDPITPENTLNFVNNEYFDINNENEKFIEEVQQETHEETNNYYVEYNVEHDEDNTNKSFNQPELEIEHSDSEEEAKPKEQRSFHMYIPKTLTPKSKKIEPIIEIEKNDTVMEYGTLNNNTNEISISMPDNGQQSNYITQDYDETSSDSSTKFKMLKRNSRWGDLLNKISKPGTYVPPTNKHSKGTILKNQKSTANPQKTDSKQDSLKSSSQKKSDFIKVERSSKTEAYTKTENIDQTKPSQPSIPDQLIYNQELKQEKTLKNYFLEQPIPDDLFIEEESTQDEEDGWGTFIDRNTIYNPKKYEQKPISPQKNSQSPTPTTVEKEVQKTKTANTGSIISNFFLPKAQEEEKKRIIKEKIEKKKEDKKAKEVEELKLQELEDQLIFYRNENEKTRRLKDELQAERQTIECERSEFKRFMEEEREKFEKYKLEENQKLKRERRILERNLKEQQQSLSRKDHEKEVNDLKEKIEKITTEFKNERTKLKSTIQALKTRNELLQDKIIELEENLKKRELERIDNNFRKKQPKDDSPPSSPVVIANPKNTTIKSQQTIPSNKNSLQANFKPENSSTNVSEKPKQSSPKTPYPNNHKLGLLKKTFQVNDSHFNVTWETDNIGEVITSRREVGKGKTEILYNTGRRDVEFSNGSVKKILHDRSSLIYFSNGDIKKTFQDGLVIYFFNNLKTTQITYPTGAEMYKFSNNQVETHFPGGEKEVIFPDKTIKFVENNGTEEIWFSDGTYAQNNQN